ncbi:MAG: SDR family oxidoreductase [Bdellovibrionaceae bacterium]|nr:SDR family oxidoreductase [Pseudobdellovibrionaceae bacterium]
MTFKDDRKVVLITGCSSGLGLSLAETLVQADRYKLIITTRGRSIEKLREYFQESPNVMVRELDVNNPVQIYGLINEICCAWGGIDTLVNNAGVCYRSVIEHMDPDAELEQLRTNYLGPMSIIRAVLPLMRERGKGHIINISSVSGSVPMPTMGSYSSSKHALEAASEALWYEARPFGVQVTLVQPGFIRSESYKNVVLSKKAMLSTEVNGSHAEFYRSMAPLVEKLMGFSLSNPRGIARKIQKIIDMSRPPFRIGVTADAVVFRILRSVLPNGLFRRLMYSLLPGSTVWGERLQSLSTSVPKVG